ncbi:hypothetical protein [Geobacillus sp. C56-T2]
MKKLSLISPRREKDELAIDLYDIYESSQNIEKLLNAMIDSQQDKEQLIDTLIEIEVELDHINWHYNSFKKQLKSLLTD